jgi:hypothetical protein
MSTILPEAYLLPYDSPLSRACTSTLLYYRLQPLAIGQPRHAYNPRYKRPQRNDTHRGDLLGEEE